MNELTPKEIGRRLREARKDKKIDVPFLASHTGLNKTTIYRYENGEVNNIKKPIIESLANILEVNPLWIIGESETKKILTSNIGNRMELDLFAKNITYLRKKKGLSQEDVSIQLGVSPHYYKKIENGIIDVTLTEVKAILEVFGINEMSSMLKDLEKIEAEQKLSFPSNSLETIRVYRKALIKDGVEIFEDPIDEITNPYHRIKKKLFALQVHGDSMNNIVADGMYAIFEKKEIVNNGDIAIVLIDGDIAMLKRFYQLGELTVVLKPDSTNPIHKSMMFENEEINRLKILGRYIGHVAPMLEILED